MISQRNQTDQKVVREFASEFEVGECWGYNRFYRIELLERDGYLSGDENDSIFLKFYVRAPTYA
jgi:tripartite motif-containing protein 37